MPQLSIMNPKNVSTNTSAAVALGAAAALAAGALAYYQTTSKAKKDIEIYKARVSELAKLRKGVNTIVSDVNESNIETAIREFRTNIAAQLRCYLGIKMPGNLEAATKFGFHGGVKTELREQDGASVGKGVFVKDQNSIRPGELVACVGGRVYTSNMLTDAARLVNGDISSWFSESDNHVTFISKTGKSVFTINTSEEPDFEVKDEVLQISLGGDIRLAKNGESANVFLYGPTTSRKGTPNENQLPCGYASECFGTDEILAFPPVVAAVALREIGPNEELLLDTRVGVCEDDWYQDIFSMNDRLAAKLRRVTSNASTASTMPSPRRACMS